MNISIPRGTTTIRELVQHIVRIRPAQLQRLNTWRIRDDLQMPAVCNGLVSVGRLNLVENGLDGHERRVTNDESSE